MNASYQIRRKIKIIINMKDSLEQSCSRLFKKRHSLIKDYVVLNYDAFLKLKIVFALNMLDKLLLLFVLSLLLFC